MSPCQPSPAFANLRLAGLIVMIGATIGPIISLAFMTARRRRTVDGPATEIYEERRHHQPQGRYQDPPL